MLPSCRTGRRPPDARTLAVAGHNRLRPAWTRSGPGRWEVLDALDRVWVPEDIGSPLLGVDFAHTGFYDEFLDRAGIALSGGREQIRAVVPSEGDRSLLGLGEHGAALAIDRLGCAKGEPVEWRHTLVRGDRFSVMAEFSARDGYQLDVSGLSPSE